jgi:hypothetical protein
MKFPVIRWNRMYVLATAATLVASLTQRSPLATGAITGWDFEDGTLQGWTNFFTPPTSGPIFYEVIGDPPGAWRPHGQFFAHVNPFANRDQPHDQPLGLRSPAFSLVPGEEISVSLLGGDGGGPGGVAGIVPTSDASVVAISSSTEGFLGVALRRVSDGAYLLAKHRTNDSVSDAQEVNFSPTELSAIIDSNPGEMFTLDLIDTTHGSFGAIAIDSTSIPVATTASLVQGGGQWNVLERISSAGRLTTLAAADALLALPSADPSVLGELTGIATAVNFHDTLTNNGYFGNDEPFITGGGNAYVTQVTGVINVVQPGEITFGFAANDGARLKIDGAVVAEDNQFGVVEYYFGMADLSAGAHAVELTYFQDTGGAALELFVATTNGTFTSVNQANFELLLASDLELPDGVPGDYDGDGDVDGADFLAWQRQLGATASPPGSGADGDESGSVDGGDLDIWKSNFGAPAVAAQRVSGAVVPEPAAFALAASAAIGLLYTSRRHRS